jgi:VIT1/CCC1 family predicted Fe2+/Mn2+ transporter
MPPLLGALLLPPDGAAYGVGGLAFVLLVFLGALAARLGGAPPLRGALRVGFWGAVAMAGTALVGHLFGAIVQ